MARPVSIKHMAIDKTNTQLVAVVAVAAFVTVFTLVAARSVWSQVQYQAKVVSAKEAAHQQLKKNEAAFGSLASAYKGFDAAPINVIGGNAQGTGDNDGPNSKIVLDALPAKYDFPALTSSIEKILTDRGFHVTSIGGTDDQLNQQTNVSSPSPQPVSVPFTFNVDGANYASIGQLMTALQQSIRPIQIDSITLAGGASNMTLTVDAHTWYQPAKNLTITQKVVK